MKKKKIEKEKVSSMIFKDFHDYYLNLDAYLLLDVILNFRQVCFKEHNLEILTFLTLPSYSWSCLMKDNKYRIDYLTDQDIYLFAESFTTGGICFPSKRYSKANNI